MEMKTPEQSRHMQESLISHSKEWEALKEHVQNNHVDLRTEFQNDPARAETLSGYAGDLYVNYSGQLVTSETIELLYKLAKKSNVESKIQAMFRGDIINLTEKRPALHTALRTPIDAPPILVDGKNILPEIHRVLNREEEFVEKIYNKTWRGSTGDPIKNVVAIGIGGSIEGSRMACEALDSYRNKDINVRFVSNVDPSDLKRNLEDLDPKETLFIVISKTFTTAEAIGNAKEAKKWLTAGLKEKTDISKHFVAVSTNKKEVEKFGIDTENMFEIWDWVGGRTSITGASGLPIMLSIGSKKYREMLEGFRIVDEHYRTAPLEANIPVKLALLDILNTNFYDIQSHALMGYSSYLKSAINHLEQLEMESKGKCVDENGTPIDFNPSSVVWGGVGTDQQHITFQHLLQNPVPVAVDLIGFKRPINPKNDPYTETQHKELMANMVGESEALTLGATTEQLRELGIPEDQIAASSLPGNRPTTIILGKKLTPKSLGELIALFEHKTYAVGAILKINPSDQPAVQFGKVMAKRIKDELINNGDSQTTKFSTFVNTLADEIKGF
jgi:glucose-6-phosphate isomerase